MESNTIIQIGERLNKLVVSSFLYFKQFLYFCTQWLKAMAIEYYIKSSNYV